MQQLDKGIIFRILLSVVLATAAVGLFLVSKSTHQQPAQHLPRDIAATAAEVDREVDSILAHFNIEKGWIHKRQIAVANTDLRRTERRVIIPNEVLPVQVNHVLNMMAKRHDGRAIASENLKENTVTIHIELEGYILQSIILKPTKELTKAPLKLRPRKA